MAEGILRDKTEKLGIEAEIDSAGLEAFHIGDPPDDRAILTAKKRRIDITGHRARLFTAGDFDRFDRIFVMDSFHYFTLGQMSRSDQDMNKVDYAMNLLYPGKNIPVQDPWYDGMSSFEKVYEQLDQVCTRLAELIAGGKTKEKTAR